MFSTAPQLQPTPASARASSSPGISSGTQTRNSTHRARWSERDTHASSSRTFPPIQASEDGAGAAAQTPARRRVMVDAGFGMPPKNILTLLSSGTPRIVDKGHGNEAKG